MSRLALYDTPEPAIPRVALDVSQLPGAPVDHRSPIWWGNVLMLFIESTTVALLFASYFYLRQNFETWPPPRVDQTPILYDPNPTLGWATAALVVLLASVAPMLWADLSCLWYRDGAERQAKLGLLATDALGLLASALVFLSLFSLRCRWDDNAYGSIVWTIVVLLFIYVLAGVCENGILTAWVLVKGLDIKHARDIRVGATYWYWVVLVWVLVYVIVFLGPRWM